jgi:uncharacterized protein (TIGR02246 family)
MFLTRTAVTMLTFLNVAASARAATGDAATIAALLQRSTTYWNSGQLDAFMRGYEQSPDTTYVSSKTVIHGYGNIRAHYAAAYHGSHTGTLSLADISVRLLGTDYAVVVARWQLRLHDGTHPSGLFTLVLHRAAAGWHIITDHSP